MVTGTPDLSRLPQIDALLQHEDAEEAIAVFGRRAMTEALRTTLDDVRDRARSQGGIIPRADELLATATGQLAKHRDRRLRRVINATGVVLHTNLGRAPLSSVARDAMIEASGYGTLEYDLEDGGRGSRTTHVGSLAAEACGTEAATVVNNGAAALVLVLAALATGKNVIVSRGEMIEIGGSFRLPDIMAASGARLREVGTTNRTRVADYRAAVDADTALILKVHPSNYRVVGFAETPDVAELAAMAHDEGLPLVFDTGSGLLHPHEDGPVSDEPSVAEAIAAGTDLVVFSGDKLLGGPQAGIIAGRSDLVLRCARHPLARALRIDKFRRAALEATLESHLRAEVPRDLPTWAMLTADPGLLRARAEAVAAEAGDAVEAIATSALVGGGSTPGVDLPSWGVVVRRKGADELAAALRRQEPPVIARVENGRVVLDLRTVPPNHDHDLARALRDVLDTHG